LQGQALIIANENILKKAGGETLRAEIHKLLNSISNKEELPEQWKDCITVLNLYEWR
jgi:hypothetical protein